MPVRALILLALVCPASLDLAVVVGLSSGCSPSLADALPLLSSISSPTDALLPRVSWSLPRRMLGRRWLFGPLSGRCFATERISWQMLRRHDSLN
jgi:hypothetical protein